METQIAEQRAQIQRLEDLVYRLMHRTRLSTAGDQSTTETTKARRISVSSQQSPTTSPKRGRERRSSILSFQRSRSK